MTNIKMNVQGFAKWVINKANSDGSKGDLVQKGGEQENLVVNSGLELMATTSPQGASTRCRVGTGNSSPITTQVDLDSRYGAVSNNGGNLSSTSSGSAPWWNGLVRDYEFPAGTIDGAALAEFGFFDGSGGDMFSRLLFRDGGGTPITITLLPDEILTVSYEIRLYVPNIDVVGTFDVSDGTTPTTYNYTLRAARASSEWIPGNNIAATDCRARETDVLASIDGIIGGTSEALVVTSQPYIPNSYQHVYDISAGIGTANFATGIGSITSQSSSDINFQVVFSPKLPKDNTKTMSMTGFLTISWASGTP